MQDLSKMTDSFSKAAVGYERIQEVMDMDAAVRDTRKAIRAPRFKGLIEFDRVHFAYEGRPPVLRGVSLRIEPGQLAALVGPTGAGKTTLISLIARFYDPLSGTVKIDGRNIQGFTQNSLRHQISLVLQETMLFHGSVWYNIAYGKPQATRAEIERAAELANAMEFIRKMPDGFDTIIGERGLTLSGGQRQRIAIARAVIRDSPILILDEPGTGLDAASEQLVFEALDNLMEGKTTLVIAHRLSTVRRADVIFVLNDGQIIESGRHEDLMRRRGLYSQLYELQFGDRPLAS
jgi:subfamily B ATP-binding cassette protein MsbA